MDFFILGNPRSGTSLLRIILNTHSKIGVPPESGFLHWWYFKYKDWSIQNSQKEPNVDEYLDDLLTSKKIEGWNLDRGPLKQFILNEKPNDYLGLVTSVYQYYTKKEVIGDKNNYYINHLEEINVIANSPVYIHIIRDGRDVACSYRQIKKLETNKHQYLPNLRYDIKDIAEEWNLNVNKIEEFLADKVAVTIKYEDLIKTPQTVIKQLTAFLGLNFEKEVLKFYTKNDEPSITSEWKKKTFEKIDSSNLGKYKVMLSPKEIENFNTICKNNLEKFGYEK